MAADIITNTPYREGDHIGGFFDSVDSDFLRFLKLTAEEAVYDGCAIVPGVFPGISSRGFFSGKFDVMFFAFAINEIREL